jgi:hypothetical protein
VPRPSRTARLAVPIVRARTDVRAARPRRLRQAGGERDAVLGGRYDPDGRECGGDPDGRRFVGRCDHDRLVHAGVEIVLPHREPGGIPALPADLGGGQLDQWASGGLEHVETGVLIEIVDPRLDREPAGLRRDAEEEP